MRLPPTSQLLRQRISFNSSSVACMSCISTRASHAERPCLSSQMRTCRRQTRVLTASSQARSRQCLHPSWQVHPGETTPWLLSLAATGRPKTPCLSAEHVAQLGHPFEQQQRTVLLLQCAVPRGIVIVTLAAAALGFAVYAAPGQALLLCCFVHMLLVLQ